MKNKDANSLFRDNEKKELYGKKKRNIILLSLVLLSAVLSVSFASACMKYLEYKMEDRFVNSIDITSWQYSGNGDADLKSFLYESCDLEAYGIENIEDVYTFDGRFYKANRGERHLYGRSCMENSPILYNSILSDQNVVDGKKCLDTLSNRDMALIVSEDALEVLGFDNDVSFLEYYSNDTIHPVSIPIYAIVKDLPGMNDFMATEAFFKQMFIGDINKSDYPFQVTSSDNNGRLLMCVPESIKNAIVKRIKYDGFSVREVPFRMSYSNEYTKLIVESPNVSNIEFYDSLFYVYTSEFSGIERVYDIDFPDPDSEYKKKRSPQYFSCYFKSDSLAQNVDNFSKLLKEEMHYRLDMNKIESLKNFHMVQRMGNILSVVIMSISILFLCLFIYFLLSSHFQKIQMNLGTFKAFGVSNKSLFLIYINIICRMLILAFVFSFAISIAVSFVLQIFGCVNEPGYPYFDVFTIQSVILLCSAAVASVVTTYIVLHLKLTHTPGNLIYQRVENKP